MMWLAQAWRMTVRDWRAGELRLILAALAVAVAAVTSVGFLADRMRLALERDGAQLLGADVVLNSDIAVGPAVREEAATRGISVTDTVLFPSMALAGHGERELAQLASVKAVAPGYPLRGRVRLLHPEAGAPLAAGAADYAAQDIPPPGSVWVEPNLLSLLELDVGDELRLGDSAFRVDNVISLEPDRGMSFVNLSPRLLMRVDDLAATGLVSFGSRLSYRILFAGESEAIADFTKWLSNNLEQGQRIETLASGRPEMRRTIDRAQQFLSLVAMLAVLIATVAIAMSARRYMLRHLAGVAVMRCLGATQRQISRQMAAEFLMIALAGAALGCALGYLVHLGLLAALDNVIDTELPPPSVVPALQGLLAGVWLLLGFALPALAPLRRVPPARVLRQDEDLPTGGAYLGYAAGILGFIALLCWVAGQWRLGLVTAGGFLTAFALFGVLAWAGLWALAPFRRLPMRSVAWRFALAGLVRRRAATVAQICALSIGLMALLLLTLTRTDLVAGWRTAAPPDAPNRFLINIQSHQRAAVSEFLAREGIVAKLSPVVRGRLIAINGEPLDSSMYAERRARRMIDRESNLSYTAEMPANNRLTAGRWFSLDEPEVSMDQEVAATLGLKLDDVLTYEVAGKRTSVRLTSLREPDWDSMAVNFFVLTSPDALRDAPQSWITSFHIPPEEPDPLPALVAQFPNLSVFNVSAILRQVQQVLDQVIVAVQGLFVFTLLAGVLVLYAALSASRDERIREAALLRALGATRQQLAHAQWLELGLIGAAAGGLAAFAASVLGWVLARYVFQFALFPGLWVWGAGIAGGVLAALVGGHAGLRGVLNSPPLATLRAA